MNDRLEKLTALLLDPGDEAAVRTSALGELGFADPERALKLWEGMMPTAGLGGVMREHAASLLGELAGCPDPDMALVTLGRFVDATISPAQFIGSIFLERPLCNTLITLLSTSYYLADILIRNPGYFSWLIERDTLTRRKPFGSYRKELEALVAIFRDPHRKINGIKRYKRREMLRIGARDILGMAGVPEITAELSALADAVIETALELSFEMEAEATDLYETVMTKDWSRPFSRFAVISMGKLGGSELNYSSDIDLLYVCGSESTREERAFYTAVARRLTDILGSGTEEGRLYRVDLRLRPDGETGPLVTSLEEHLNYLLRRGRPWERQALIKARFTAGNLRTGESFEQNCHRVIFQSIIDSDPLSEILAMRERAIALLPVGERERNIKLMPGGIRDIEFMTQALQLIHGRPSRELRARNTLVALDRLALQGRLSAEVHDALRASYELFRTVEHRLQLLLNTRTHTLPQEGAELDKLGARVELSALAGITAPSFRPRLSRAVRSVQKLFDEFFRGGSKGNIPLLLSLPAGEEEVGRILAGYGIRDGDRAHRFLLSLVYGDFPKLETPDTLAAAAANLPRILERVSLTPDPSLTLKNLVRIVKATGAARSTIELLGSGNDFLRLMLNISAISSLLTETIAARPGLLDMVAAGHIPGVLDDPVTANEMDIERISRWYKEMLLHVHCQNPIPERGPEVLGPLFAGVNEEAIKHLFTASGCAEAGVTLFALGSLGSRECHFGSDLDLVAVAKDGANLKMAGDAVRILIDLCRRAGLPKIDLRLRGEGKGAPIVQTVSQYGRYFDGRAGFWEAVAFARCRFICGYEETAAEFTRRTEAFLESSGRREDAVVNLLAEREKLAALSSDPWNIKQGAGGEYDITFLLAYAAMTDPALHAPLPPAGDSLSALAAAGSIGKEDADLLLDAHRLYYLVTHAAALHGIPYPPHSEREVFLDGYMGRLLGKEDADSPFTSELEAVRKSVREIFLVRFDREKR